MVCLSTFLLLVCLGEADWLQLNSGGTYSRPSESMHSWSLASFSDHHIELRHFNQRIDGWIFSRALAYHRKEVASETRNPSRKVLGEYVGPFWINGSLYTYRSSCGPLLGALQHPGLEANLDYTKQPFSIFHFPFSIFFFFPVLVARVIILDNGGSTVVVLVSSCILGCVQRFTAVDYIELSKKG